MSCSQYTAGQGRDYRYQPEGCTPGDGEGTEVSDLAKAEKIAEKLRDEPYKLFRNDCLTKSAI